MPGSSSSVDKQWAQKYILDPLTAPEPSQLDGPGSSFARPGRSLSISKPAEKSTLRKNERSSGTYPTPPTSSSPTRGTFESENPFSDPPRIRFAPVSDDQQRNRPGFGRSHSSNLAPGSSNYYPPSASVGRSQSVRQPLSNHPRPAAGHSRSHSANLASSEKGRGIHRSGSLSQRFPGDMSHRPLDIIKRDARAADRAPHLRKTGMPGTDIIDNLDTIGGTYHHGGPFDATLVSRNTNKMYSPVEAVRESNMAAIRATPREYLQESLRKHVPLQGVAAIPPGGVDIHGNVMEYEEGADLMREPDAAGGAYKRWDGIPYHPDDMKGKGEPSYTVERDLKETKARLRRQAAHNSDGTTIELQSHHSSNSSSGRKDLGAQVRQRSISAADGGSRPGASKSQEGALLSPNSDLRRSNTTGKRLTDGLKRRFGSFRRKRSADED